MEVIKGQILTSDTYLTLLLYVSDQRVVKLARLPVCAILMTQTGHSHFMHVNTQSSSQLHTWAKLWNFEMQSFTRRNRGAFFVLGVCLLYRKLHLYY